MSSLVWDHQNEANGLMLYINGKFLAQRTTGVQRFALGLLLALDQSLARKPGGRHVVLLTPPGVALVPGLQVIEQRACGRSGRLLTWWEQFELPFHCRHGKLLCLSGSAPLLARRCIPTIHDAAIYLHPAAYSRKFVAWYRLLFSRMARQAPLVITVSDNSAGELSGFLPGTRFRVVHNAAEHITEFPADPSVLRTHGLRPRGYILAVGSLNPTKNFAALLAAYRAAGFGKEMPLVIAGGLNSEVFSRHVPGAACDSIVWAGPVTDPQLRALYENAGVFAFPSLYEGFGIPPLEAMKCGCPVVVSNAASIPEVCGDAALYFAPREPAALGAALARVLRDDALRQELVEKGRERSRLFSWEQSGEQLRGWLVEADYLAS